VVIHTPIPQSCALKCVVKEAYWGSCGGPLWRRNINFFDMNACILMAGDRRLTEFCPGLGPIYVKITSFTASRLIGECYNGGCEPLDMCDVCGLKSSFSLPNGICESQVNYTRYDKFQKLTWSSTSDCAEKATAITTVCHRGSGCVGSPIVFPPFYFSTTYCAYYNESDPMLIFVRGGRLVSFKFRTGTKRRI